MGIKSYQARTWPQLSQILLSLINFLLVDSLNPTQQKKDPKTRPIIKKQIIYNTSITSPTESFHKYQTLEQLLLII